MDAGWMRSSNSGDWGVKRGVPEGYMDMLADELGDGGEANMVGDASFGDGVEERRDSGCCYLDDQREQRRECTGGGERRG